MIHNIFYCFKCNQQSAIDASGSGQSVIAR